VVQEGERRRDPAACSAPCGGRYLGIPSCTPSLHQRYPASTLKAAFTEVAANKGAAGVET
jgi:hypothetical protein